MVLKVLNGVLVMAGIGALTTIVALLAGIENGFWPVSLAFALGLSYALAVIAGVRDGVWIGLCAAALFVGLRYYLGGDPGQANGVFVLAFCVVLFGAIQGHILLKRRAHSR